MVMVSLVVPGEEVDGLTSLRYMRANSRPSSFPPGKYQGAGAWIWRALKWLTIATVLLTPWYALSPTKCLWVGGRAASISELEEMKV